MGSLHPTLSALSHRTGRINPVHETQPDPPVTFADRAATNKPSEGSAYARIDARLAFALPSDYRTRGEVSRYARGCHAVGRRSHSSHQLRRNSCARAESIATARRALAAQPRVLMLDEPSMGLAPQVVAEILRLILRMRHELGLGILLVEQNAEAALRIADHACVLSLGQITLPGAGADLLNDPSVVEAFLGGNAAT